MYMLLSASPPFQIDSDEKILKKAAMSEFTFNGQQWENTVKVSITLKNLGFFEDLETVVIDLQSLGIFSKPEEIERMIYMILWRP